VYKFFLKPLLFLLSAETAHHFTICILKYTKAWGFRYKGSETPVTKMGLVFKNRLGLAAGLDKNAVAMDAWKSLGFGFIEVGTVTPKAQPGNPKPRLFRLPKDYALINRMGFNNQGMERIYKRLISKKPKNLILGVNIGKNKDTPNELAILDYELCFKTFYKIADFIVVNVSSPNTPNLRALQDRDQLSALMLALNSLAKQLNTAIPLLLKIAPDLNSSQLDDIIELIEQYNWTGVVSSNTSISRNDLHAAPHTLETIGNGGLSGKPIEARSTEIIRYLRSKLSPKRVIIGVGGILSPMDAQNKISAGADLIQVYTGLIYEGPQLVHNILSTLHSK
jgi:dihydroorotate dehydrogenase